MSDYHTTLRFLYDLQLFGIKVGLENIKSLLSFLGNPEKRLTCIHIAGTNGKGSTAAMIASILTASGYKTGLYTSPHLIDFPERIRIDGESISRRIIVELTKSLRPIIERRRATFFEATTAIAYQYFADQEVDVAVIETGLGGRWDATNVITPILSIITNIGLEHTEYLGKTYSHIAFEKGGIIKPGVACLTGTTNKAALNTLRRIAKRKASHFSRAPGISSDEIRHRSLSGLRANIRTKRTMYRNLDIRLAGDHQASNAQLALLAMEEMQDAGFERVSKKSVRDGLRSIRKNTSFRGRMEILSEQPPVVADVAHNPDGIQAQIGRASCRERVYVLV